MTKQYLLPMARSLTTGRTIKTQDLTGARFELHQRVLAQDLADQVAERMTQRTGETWVGFLETYTPRTKIL